MSSSPTDEETKTVARAAVGAFRARGFKTCLFGGAACRQYGTNRTPGDVDVVVMTSSHTTEELKNILVGMNRKFYLRPSRKIGETYKIVFYKLAPTLAYPRRSCKVDILIPGILNIPHVPSYLIVTANNIPLMPLIPLLLLKLQGWEDHRESSRSDMQQKQYVDIRDISQLLQIAVRKGESLQTASEWLPADFVDAGRERLARYLETVRPVQTQGWKDIGFSLNV